MHDTLLVALQCKKKFSKINFLKKIQIYIFFLTILIEGLNKDENESINELVETNRHLSAAMDKMELRCKMAEEKANKMKSYKKIVKNCSAH